MPNDIITIGENGIRELPEVQITDSSVALTTVYTLEGNFDDLLKNGPQRGQTHPKWLGIVQDVKYTRGDGNIGRAQVTMVASPTQIDGGSKKISEPRFEVFSGSEECALETHPMFSDGSNNSAKMTDNCTITVPEGDSSDETTLRDILVRTFGVAGDVTLKLCNVVALYKTLSADERRALLEVGLDQPAKLFIKKFFELWDKGVQAYRRPFPYARKTTTYTGPVPFSSIAVIQNPDGFPDGILPSGYKWLKEEDSFHFTGKHGTCELVEGWRGYRQIEEDLYSAPAA